MLQLFFGYSFHKYNLRLALKTNEVFFFNITKVEFSNLELCIMSNRIFKPSVVVAEARGKVSLFYFPISFIILKNYIHIGPI